MIVDVLQLCLRAYLCDWATLCRCFLISCSLKSCTGHCKQRRQLFTCQSRLGSHEGKLSFGGDGASPAASPGDGDATHKGGYHPGDIVDGEVIAGDMLDFDYADYDSTSPPVGSA